MKADEGKILPIFSPLSKSDEKRIFRAMPKHITLVGMMGSGKSTVAPLVAAPLKRPVIEVDELIEEHEKMPIGEIFIAKGEAYFRRVESDMIASLLSKPPAVLSLGGGAFQWETTRDLLERRGAYYGMAHYRVETDFHSPENVAKSILMMREAYA